MRAGRTVLGMVLLLAGCASVPPAPRVTRPEAPALPDPAATTATTDAAAPSAGPASAATAGTPARPEAAGQAEVWTALREGFALDDCGQPEAVEFARFFARHPKRLVGTLDRALPQIDYLSRRMRAANVPAEFALLPWVESRYRALPGKPGRPAGMWQLAPGTARTLGVPVGRHYDGRLDPVASTTAVLRLLQHDHDWFQDWRLADYAYNAGRNAIERAVEQTGAPPATPVLPALPVRPTVRRHLAQLLGMACLIRDPQRFHVSLPELPAARRLQVVRIPRKLTVPEVARLAGISTARLQATNAGYRDGAARVRAGDSLLLAAAPAAQLQQALADAMAGAHPPAPPEPRRQTHRVATGETLWRIARQYAVSVQQLRRWNGLRGDSLVVGQMLRVSAAPK